MVMDTINIKSIAEELQYKNWEEIRNKINELSDFPNTLEETLYFANELWTGKEKNKGNLIGKFNVAYYIEDKKKYFLIDGAKYNISNLYASFNCVGCDKVFNFCYQWHDKRPLNSFLCRKCKKSIVHKCDDYRLRYENSMLEKYGVKRPYQSEVFMQKFCNTMQERYGVNFSGESPELLAKTREKLKFNGKSKIEDQFSKIIKEKYGSDRIKCTGRERVYIDKKWVYPDIIIDGTKIIEFFGDYWHGNPKLYKSDAIIAHDCQAKDIWEFDKQRLKLMESAGYKVLVIWEQDWIKTKDKVLTELDEWIKK